nr:histone-like nucleoid-structuring protein, MvaT/MvaU family [Pseudomonas aegrilactucae]
MEALKKDSGLKREIEFEQKLVALMKKYDKGLREIIDILDPGASARRPQSVPKTRRARVVKVYENPHTGERIETKGGNHHGLKAWKQEYGAQTVDSWLKH